MLFVFTKDFGMESHLSCFIIALYLLIKSIELKSNVSFALLKCFLLMLLSLAKIDFIFTVVPVIIIFDYLSASKIFRNKCLIGSFASLLLVISIYFGSNYIFFGNLMNISGAIKNSFPHILFYENIIEISKPGTFFNQFAKIIFTFIVILIFAVFLFGKKYKEKHSKYDLFQLGVGIAVLSYILLNLTIF